MIQTREQRYVEPIFQKVTAVANSVKAAKAESDAHPDDSDLKTALAKARAKAEKYDNAAKTLPVLIRSAGLVQALYFAEGKDDGSKQLVEDLSAVIAEPSLREDARTCEIDRYMVLTERCMLALKWFKRFGEIELKSVGES